jgi:hypothetical protein
MASATKSTGLQIALVFAVMTAIVAIVVAFLGYRSANETEGRLSKANEQRQLAESARQTADTNLTNLKAFMGYPPGAEVGKPEAEDDATIIGKCKKLISDNAPGDIAKPTIVATIQNMGQKNDNSQKQLDSMQTENNGLQQKILQLESQYRQVADSYNKKAEKAEKDLTDAHNSKEQEVAQKEKEIQADQTKIQELQSTVQSQQQDHQKLKDQTKGQIVRLEEINRVLRKKKEEEAAVTFDEPSGHIDWIDRETGLVWVDRGEADSLRKGVTFSVYKQVNKGVARGAQDIKGAIEVTKVISAHQSEGRITKANISDPIIQGDPIYTPLWKNGEKQKFAFVGLIDIDHDGVGDRDILHDLVAAANGEVTDEVDDQGIRHPTQGNINVGTKFLVIGEIPDFTQSKQQDKEAHRKMGELRTKMEREAAEHGVRVVSLPDFLSYVGYEPGRRIFRPGVTSEYNLRAGMAGTTPRPTPTSRRQSGGTVSGAFIANPNLKQKESGGTTSKIFKPQSQ